jgi:hypothetical protein
VKNALPVGIDKYGKKMKKNICLFLLCSFFISKSYAQVNIVENLIEKVIEKNLPYLLYQHKDKPWDMGVYSLQIERLGKATFATTTSDINLSFPVKAKIDGEIKQNLFGTKIAIACQSNFDSEAAIKITPTIKTGKANENSTVKVAISVNVPPTNLACDGLTIPIKAVLETLIQENKKTWEQDLTNNINKLFKQAGI